MSKQFWRGVVSGGLESFSSALEKNEAEAKRKEEKVRNEMQKDRIRITELNDDKTREIRKKLKYLENRYGYSKQQGLAALSVYGEPVFEIIPAKIEKAMDNDRFKLLSKEEQQNIIKNIIQDTDGKAFVEGMDEQAVLQDYLTPTPKFADYKIDLGTDPIFGQDYNEMFYKDMETADASGETLVSEASPKIDFSGINKYANPYEKIVVDGKGRSYSDTINARKDSIILTTLLKNPGLLGDGNYTSDEIKAAMEEISVYTTANGDLQYEYLGENTKKKIHFALQKVISKDNLEMGKMATKKYINKELDHENKQGQEVVFTEKGTLFNVLENTPLVTDTNNNNTNYDANIEVDILAPENNTDNKEILPDNYTIDENDEEILPDNYTIVEKEVSIPPNLDRERLNKIFNIMKEYNINDRTQIKRFLNRRYNKHVAQELYNFLTGDFAKIRDILGISKEVENSTSYVPSNTRSRK